MSNTTARWVLKYAEALCSKDGKPHHSYRTEWSGHHLCQRDKLGKGKMGSTSTVCPAEHRWQSAWTSGTECGST